MHLHFQVPLFGNSVVYLPVQVAVNIPWMVAKECHHKGLRVPPEHPKAIFPQELVNLILKNTMPNDIMKHMSGTAMPECLFNAIRGNRC